MSEIELKSLDKLYDKTHFIKNFSFKIEVNELPTKERGIAIVFQSFDKNKKNILKLI